MISERDENYQRRQRAMSEKDDPGRVHETFLGISHAYPNRLNQLYQTAMVSLRSIGWERDRLIANRRNSI